MKHQNLAALVASALLFAIASRTNAAEFPFSPDEIELNSTEWRNVDNDTDWSFKPPFIIRLSNKGESRLEFTRAIPNFFEITFELSPATLGKSNGKGLKIFDAAGKSWSVVIDDDSPFAIYDAAAKELAKSPLRLKVGHRYKFVVRAAKDALYADVDGKHISSPWVAMPPFTIAFMSQRSGVRISHVTINEIKK